MRGRLPYHLHGAIPRRIVQPAAWSLALRHHSRAFCSPLSEKRSAWFGGRFIFIFTQIPLSLWSWRLALVYTVVHSVGYLESYITCYSFISFVFDSNSHVFNVFQALGDLKTRIWEAGHILFGGTYHGGVDQSLLLIGRSLPVKARLRALPFREWRSPFRPC